MFFKTLATALKLPRMWATFFRSVPLNHLVTAYIAKPFRNLVLFLDGDVFFTGQLIEDIFRDFAFAIRLDGRILRHSVSTPHNIGCMAKMGNVRGGRRGESEPNFRGNGKLVVLSTSGQHFPIPNPQTVPRHAFGLP